MLGFATASAHASPAAVFALMATYGWMPKSIMGLATPFFWPYPLSQEVQRDLRRADCSSPPQGAVCMTKPAFTAPAEQRNVNPKAEQACRTRVLGRC